MTIDVWMQHPTLRFLRHSMFESLRRWTGQEVPTEELPVEMTIAAMDAAGVEFGLISAWHAPEGPLITNDEVAKFVAAHPKRIAGLASVDLHKPTQAVRALRRCVKELGFKGLRVVPWLWGLPPNDRRYYPLYAECVELGVPFCTQVGHTGPLRSSETGRPIPYLDDVALDFPELVIVAGHIGYPWTEEMIALARKYPNVYIDTSAYTAKRYPPELVRYMQGGGRKKVLFGTNYPMILPQKALEGLDGLGLDAETRELFLSGSAGRRVALRSRRASGRHEARGPHRYSRPRARRAPPREFLRGLLLAQPHRPNRHEDPAARRHPGARRAVPIEQLLATEVEPHSGADAVHHSRAGRSPHRLRAQAAGAAGVS
jgi:uncharacterized protein